MSQIKRKHASTKHLTKIIESEVSWFNGWSATESAVHKSCQKATVKILRYLRKKGTGTKVLLTGGRPLC
jgi:hypothetical protein